MGCYSSAFGEGLLPALLMSSEILTVGKARFNQAESLCFGQDMKSVGVQSKAEQVFLSVALQWQSYLGFGVMTTTLDFCDPNFCPPHLAQPK